MSISVTDIINMHPFVPNPSEQSPFPVGIWKAQRTQVTDASGGIVRWVASPQNAFQAEKYLWSMEEFSFITSASSADIGVHVEVNTGEVVSRAGGSEVLRFAQELASVTAYTPTRLSSLLTQPRFFLFIHQPGGGNLNQYIMEAGNVNAQVYTMTFWGYFWNSYARRLASGPIRRAPRL